MIMNKKGIEKLTVELLIVIGVIAMAGFLYILVFKGGIERGGKGVMTQINVLGDADGDNVINRDDTCCAAACSARPSQVDSDARSPFFGCTAVQGATNCTSSVCFLDYDKDNVNNDLDKCCAPQCKPKTGEMVNLECPGSKCGCTSKQKPTGCDEPPEVACGTE
ncbi:MAG: hypothetical protein KKE20_04125 [Nanoarchaeota archaeon]|nr:hypothetical protein [Nanoarchaeota archaeon]